MTEDKKIELNTIIQGDCLEVMKTFPDACVDMVLTSPPYNRKRNDKYKHYTDIVDDYFGWLCLIIDECLRVCNGNVFFNIQKNYYNKKDVFDLIGKYSNKIYDIIIWEKSNPMPANGNNITNAYEFIIVFGDKLKSTKTYTKNHITTSVAKMINIHKAIMHEDVANFLIDRFSNDGDIILDPMAGSGTTLKMAKKNNRNYIGIEISPEYIEIINQRINI